MLIKLQAMFRHIDVNTLFKISDVLSASKIQAHGTIYTNVSPLQCVFPLLCLQIVTITVRLLHNLSYDSSCILCTVRVCTTLPNH